MPVTQEFEDRFEIDSWTQIRSFLPNIREQYGRRVLKYIEDEQEERHLGDSIRVTIKVEKLDKAEAIEAIKRGVAEGRQKADDRRRDMGDPHDYVGEP
jgi:hypothetical protein